MSEMPKWIGAWRTRDGYPLRKGWKSSGDAPVAYTGTTNIHVAAAYTRDDIVAELKVEIERLKAEVKRLGEICDDAWGSDVTERLGSLTIEEFKKL